MTKDTDRLFTGLVKNGYIDESGILQDEFRKLKDGSELVLAKEYSNKKIDIYKVLKMP